MDSEAIMNLQSRKDNDICSVTSPASAQMASPHSYGTNKPLDCHYSLKLSKLQLILILILLQVTCFGALAHINWKTHFAGP